MIVQCITLAVELLLADGKSGKNELKIRASPPISLHEIRTGCANVLLIAEITGPETEEWYCPKVEWIKPDGTVSMVESDCPAFEERNSCQPPAPAECALDWHFENGQFVVDNNPCGCTVPGFPRRWLIRLCAPPHPVDDEMWEVTARLSKSGRVVAQQTARFLVR